MFSKGTNVLGFYALRDIKKEEELFFDYDGDGELYNSHREKYPFIKKKKWSHYRIHIINKLSDVR